MYAGSTFSCTLLQLQTMPPPMRFHLADWEGTMCGLTAQAHARSCACPLASCWWCLSVVLRQMTLPTFAGTNRLLQSGTWDVSAWCPSCLFLHIRNANSSRRISNALARFSSTEALKFLPAPTTAVGEAIFVRMAWHVVGSPLTGIVTLGRATGEAEIAMC
jgi:hypothetical protein